MAALEICPLLTLLRIPIHIVLLGHTRYPSPIWGISPYGLEENPERRETALETQLKKRAFVTGASGGIGKAIAEQFAQNGINLIITARRLDVLRTLSEEWSNRHGIDVAVYESDLSVPGAAQALADTVLAAYPQVDYLVNNAGYGSFGMFADSDLENELSMMTINMNALTILTKKILPSILDRKGKIMNLGSTASFQPGPYMAVYYATKAYVLSFSQALASELEGTGVTVTTLCPGPTRSGFQDKASMNNSGLVKGRKIPTADEVGKAGYRAMMAGKRVYIHGVMNTIMAESTRFFPRKMVTSVVKSMSKPK